ncbi:type II toxin-antitoxin system RelE/ParE family toxin [candidate division KSB1 bacterium]|nr:type II toxin-antitoxin system RelE/ParE family toxin [candidate division KSB1 bacterium]
MLPNYEVEFEAKAYDDLKEIADYLAEYSLKALQKFQDHLESHLKLLRRMPKIGSVPRDNLLRKKGYCFLLLENYLLFYVIENNKIIVRRIIHQKRDYFRIL